MFEERLMQRAPKPAVRVRISVAPPMPSQIVVVVRSGAGQGALKFPFDALKIALVL
jgi:hypothetical protein